MQTNVQLRGFRELDKALGDLVQATSSARGRAALRNAGKAALEPMAARAAALAPVRSGLLAFSLAVSERGTRRAEWRRSTSRFVAPGLFSGVSQSSTIVVAMGPSGPFHGQLYYASFVEFGTHRTAAKPYMRPAWDAGKEGAVEIVKATLWEIIERTTQRLALRRAPIGA